MSWSKRIRRLSTLVPWTTLLLATACGGGDKNPTGPEPGPGPGPGGNEVEFELVALGRVGLPVDLALEDCTPTRFYSGRIEIDPTSGQWQIRLQVHDHSGDWDYLDRGQSVGDGTTVWFDSEVSGTRYQGTVNGNGTEVTITYDWCYNGVPDVQLVFGR